MVLSGSSLLFPFNKSVFTRLNIRTCIAFPLFPCEGYLLYFLFVFVYLSVSPNPNWLFGNFHKWQTFPIPQQKMSPIYQENICTCIQRNLWSMWENEQHQQQQQQQTSNKNLIIVLHRLMFENCKLFALKMFHLKNDKGLNFVYAYDKNGVAVDFWLLLLVLPVVWLLFCCCCFCCFCVREMLFTSKLNFNFSMHRHLGNFHAIHFARLCIANCVRLSEIV